MKQMKILLIGILVCLITSCTKYDTPIMVKSYQGEIVRVERYQGRTIIKVRYSVSYKDAVIKDKIKHTNDWQWFEASDTCRVGQVVKLR